MVPQRVHIKLIFFRKSIEKFIKEMNEKETKKKWETSQKLNWNQKENEKQIFIQKLFSTRKKKLYWQNRKHEVDVILGLIWCQMHHISSFRNLFNGKRSNPV